MTKKFRDIIIVIFLALIIRVAVVWIATGYRENSDILRYKDWARIAVLYGPAHTYTPTYLTFGTYPNNQPPGTLYSLIPMYRAWLFAGNVLTRFGIAPGSNAWINVVLQTIMLKIPSLVADLGIGILIYAFVRLLGKSTRVSAIAASAFLFHPAVMYNSAFWGQMDAVNNFFSILGFYLVFRGYAWAGVIMFIASILTKSSLVYLVPLMGLLAFRSVRFVHIASMIALSVSAVWIFVWPVSHTGLFWYLEYLRDNAAGEMSNITAFAFNAWWLVFRPVAQFGDMADLTKVVDVRLVGAPLTQSAVGPVSLGFIAGIISFIMLGWIYFRYIRSAATRPVSILGVMRAYAALAVAAFLVLPHMHERYLYPAFVPLAILVGAGYSIRREFVALAVFNFVNVLVVWHPMPLPIWMYAVLGDPSFQRIIAACTVAVGGITIWKLAREH